MKYLIMVLMMALMGCSIMGQSLMPYHYIEKRAHVGAVKIIPIWVDKGFGESDKVAIDDAIKQWNYGLNGWIRLEVVSYNFDMELEILQRVMGGSGWIILKVYSGNGIIYDKPGEVTLAFVNALGGNRMYVIRDRIKNSWMFGIVLHEMGHMLGADHDDKDLMQPHFNIGEYQCIDYDAMKRVAEYQRIPIGELNYCIYEIN